MLILIQQPFTWDLPAMNTTWVLIGGVLSASFGRSRLARTNTYAASGQKCAELPLGQGQFQSILNLFK